MWRGMNVSFRDMLFLLVFGYLIISAVALAHVAKKDQEETTSANTPGHVIVELMWPRDTDAPLAGICCDISARRRNRRAWSRIQPA